MNVKLYTILLFFMLGFVSVSYGQETHLTGTLKIHPWVNLPVINSNEALGGYYQVATIEEMNAIPVERRQQGMLCTVLDDGFGKQKTYQLTGGIENKNWVVFTSGGTGTNAGDMQYWDGFSWNLLPVGKPNQFLQLSPSKIPTWSDLEIGTPVITAETYSVTEITETTAKSGGTIGGTGGSAITARGICWSMDHDPTIKNDIVKVSGSTGTFTATMTGLTGGNTYYVRAYATNMMGTTYGSEVSFPTKEKESPSIGDNYKGGKVFYILQPGDPGYVDGETHGLIAPTFDQSSGILWYDGNNLSTGATDTQLGAGAANTNAIVSSQGAGSYAAQLCHDLVLNGYDDWYLPSKDELEKLYLNQTKVGNLSGGFYWSSSEDADDNNAAWSLSSFDGGQFVLGKGSGWIVRAIRSFMIPFATFPVGVSTDEVTLVSTSAVDCGGTVIGEGGSSITARGFCWNTDGDPDITDNTIQVPGTTGSFSTTISVSNPDLTYRVKAYATNGYGTTYGLEKSFRPSSYGEIYPYGVSTNEPTEAKQTEVTCHGEVYSYGESYITARGFCWNLTGDPYIEDDTIQVSGTIGTYSKTISGLTPGYTYYVKAFATNSLGTLYGGETSFTLLSSELTIPVGVITDNPSLIKKTEVFCGGSVESDGGIKITARGVCWSVEPNENPTIENDTIIVPGTTGAFSRAISGLTPGTTYHVRAYATNILGTRYGEVIEFKTLDNSVTAPVNISTIITEINKTSVKGGGNIDSDGGTAITARGICWDTSSCPTIENNDTIQVSGTTGSFSCTITELYPGKTYHARAFATNILGTMYGRDVEFKTVDDDATAPTDVLITDVTVTSTTTAKISCNIGTDGGSSITSRGIYWSLESNPSQEDHVITVDGTTGSFTYNMTNLEAGKRYYVKAFATNSIETTCSIETSFQTLSEGATAPINVTTAELQVIDATTVRSGGSVGSDGGSPITERGICWSTSSNPTTSNSKITASGTIEPFISSMDKLIVGMTYYVRAYATNIIGTTYGNELSFKMPATGSTAPKSVYIVELFSNGTVNAGINSGSDGGSPITARGICWSTSPNPATSNSKTVVGSGTGWFLSYVTGLTVGTTYYVKAYATNIIGTTYSTEQSFTAVTPFDCGSTLNIHHNTSNKVAPETVFISYETVSSSSGYGTKRCWITKNLGASVSASSISDASAAARGWYWQFNRKQGYKVPGNGIPYGATIPSGFSYYSPFNPLNWSADNDPCTIEFGAGWRIPSKTELNYVYYNQDYTKSFVLGTLHLHNAGILFNDTGTYTYTNEGGTITLYPGESGGWMSNTSSVSSYSHEYLNPNSGSSTLNPGMAASVRCISDCLSATPVATAPTGIHVELNSVGINWATIKCTVGGNGGSDVTVSGLCWSNTPNPTTSMNKTTNGPQIGWTLCTTSALAPGTYYLRAYATNNVNTAYSDNEVSFTIYPAATAPIGVSTALVSVTGSTTATSGGNVAGDGGSSIIARGICWSTSSDPKTAPHKTTDGDTTGPFTSYLTGLSPGETYNVWAYATNSVNTTYGEPKSFQVPTPPSIITLPITNNLGGTAKSGGTVSGLSSSLQHGVVMSTSSSPTLLNTDNYVTVDGTGNGTFSSDLDNLIDGQRYYVRAYATSDFGVNTQYGTQVSFIAKGSSSSWSCGNTFVASEITYSTVLTGLSGGSKCWITQNLGASSPSSFGKAYQFGHKEGITGFLPQDYVNADSWSLSEDPCNVELGNGWRLPTYSEWSNVIHNWSSLSDSKNSDLKLYDVGRLDPASWDKYGAYYWTSESVDPGFGDIVRFDTGTSTWRMSTSEKYLGLPVRCIKD